MDPASVYHANTRVRVAIGDHVRERRLLDRQERPDLLSARADHADRRRERRGSTSCRVKANTTPAAVISTAPTMSIRRRPTRSARVVRYSETTVSPTSVEREQQTGLRLTQAEADEVEDQHDRQRAVREQPDETGGEQQPPVWRHAAIWLFA